jgi:hypothetical protein
MVQKVGVAPFSAQENLVETYPPPLTIYSQNHHFHGVKQSPENGQPPP